TISPIAGLLWRGNSSRCLVLGIGQADQLGLGPELQAETSAMAADSALARTAKRRAQVTQEKTVDPYHPGPDPRGHAQRALQIAGPDIGGKAVARRIGHRGRLLLVLEALDAQ